MESGVFVENTIESSLHPFASLIMSHSSVLVSEETARDVSVKKQNKEYLLKLVDLVEPLLVSQFLCGCEAFPFSDGLLPFPLHLYRFERGHRMTSF